jgi:hypothetical protein
MAKPTKTEKTEQQQDTTIKIAPDLKEELGKLKTDPDEPYAGVIRRLVSGQTAMESTQDIKIVAIPGKIYALMGMLLPDNIMNEIRKGVK